MGLFLRDTAQYLREARHRTMCGNVEEHVEAGWRKQIAPMTKAEADEFVKRSYGLLKTKAYHEAARHHRVVRQIAFKLQRALCQFDARRVRFEDD